MNEWEKRMILQFQLIKGIADDPKILILQSETSICLITQETITCLKCQTNLKNIEN